MEGRRKGKGTERGGEGSLPLLADHFNHWLFLTEQLVIRL